MSFKSRLLAVYQSEETIYVWWEDVLLTGTLESCVLQWLRFLFVCPVPGTLRGRTLAFPLGSFSTKEKDKCDRKQLVV